MLEGENMTNKIRPSEVRKMVFSEIDENKNGKIDKEETKLGNIFNLKEGDKKIKRKNFDKNLGISFLRARQEGAEIKYRENIDGNVTIQKCFKCDIRNKDASVKINGQNNKAIVQHENEHFAEVGDDSISVSLPKQGAVNADKAENIGLCVECNVDIVDSSIDIENTGNTLVYQNDKKTVVIQDNKEDVLIEDKNDIQIDDCEDCLREEINSKTTITGNDNTLIKQDGNNNKAKFK